MTRAITAIAVAAAALSGSARAELVMVVNPKNSVSAMNVAQVASLYLGRTATFPNGAMATPVDASEGNPMRDEFYGKVTEKSPGEVKAYRAKQMFSGKGAPPRETGSTLEMKKAVAADASAIGYIERAALDGTVKPVLTVP
jgi:ABC-type phosphate transport system substrate-binding protein